jgi:hypothetical protein
MATIASLDIALSANSAKLKKDLDAAGRRTQTFSQKVNAQTKKMAGGYNKVGAAIGAMAAVMGTKALLTNADTLNKNSRAAGLSFEAYQRLQFGYEQAGVSQEAFIKGNIKLNGQMKAAELGSKTANDNLERLGLTYEGLKEMSPEDRLLAVTDALSTVEDAGERAAISQELLGKQFAQTSLNTDEIKAAGDGLAVISDDAGTAAEKSNDAFNLLGKNASNLSTNLLAELIPTLTTVVESLSSFAKNNPFMTKVLLGVAALGVAIAVAGGPITAIAAVITGAILVFENWDAIVAKLSDVWGKFGERFPVVAKILETAVDLVMAPFRLMKDLFKEVMELFTGEDDLVTRLKNFASGITNALINNNPVVKMAQGLADAVKAPLNAVIGMFESMVNKAIDAINDLTSFEIGIPGTWAYFESKGTNIAPFSLPAFKDGGHVRGPGNGTSDSILAKLSNGEFVMNANSTKKFRPMLEAMNSGNVPGFRGGGFVSTGGWGFQDQDFGQGSSNNASFQAMTQAYQALQTTFSKPIKTEVDTSAIGTEVAKALKELFDPKADNDTTPPLTDSQKFDSSMVELGVSSAESFQTSFASGFSQAIKTGDFKSFASGLADTFTSTIIDNFAKGFTDMLFGGEGGLGGMLSGLFGGAGSFGGTIGGIFGFSKGGLVPSTPYSKLGQDSVPAMLTPGEVVVPVSEVGKQGGSQTINLNITGNIDKQTEATVLRMIPTIASGVSANNRERSRA